MLYTHAFVGIGTHWHISVNHTTEPKSLWCLIDETVKDFEIRFSRFKPESLVNQFKSSNPGSYSIDEEFAYLLNFAQTLKNATNGKFDPAVSELLSLTGYDQQYSFMPKEDKIKNWQTPVWQIKDDNLSIDGPISFDFGGFGKGYLIDKISKLILANGYPFFLVDGGGDMYGTQNHNSKNWKIAIENPVDNTQILGTIDLRHQGLAVSDIFKRRWQKRHHIVDPDSKSSKDEIISCAIISDSATKSDGLTTAFMLCKKSDWKALAKQFDCHYMIIDQNHVITIDPEWPGSFI